MYSLSLCWGGQLRDFLGEIKVHGRFNDAAGLASINKAKLVANGSLPGQFFRETKRSEEIVNVAQRTIQADGAG